MEYEDIVEEVKKFGTAQSIKIYKNHGAKDPIFGVSVANLKKVGKKILKQDNSHEIALKLFESGNYDLMYLAGLIVDSSLMTKSDFEKWIEIANCYMIADYAIGLPLAECDFASELAITWINSSEELKISAGYTSYCRLLDSTSDELLNKDEILSLLNNIEKNIHDAPNRARYAMNSFVIAVGTFYLPLQKEAIEVANKIGKVTVYLGNTSCKVPLATEYINKAIKNDKCGIKRKRKRC